jgi:hypothetical protein
VVPPFTRRRLIGLASSTLLAGCAAPALVTRDTERDPFEGGIGGTGIVGVLTELGSLKVNGLQVETTGRTRIVTPLGPVSESALAPGMALTIMADKTPRTLVARHVGLDFPLVGRLERRGTALAVNGVPLRVEPGAVRRAGPGARVAVSGLWEAGAVVASRIDPAPFSEDVIAGPVTRGGASGLAVGGTPVRLSSGAAFPPSGAYATAIGRHGADGFVAERLALGRFDAGARGLRQLAVEGYLERVRAAPGFRIAGLGHSFAEGLTLAPLFGRRAVYVGPYDGRFDARAGYVVPEGVVARRRLLGTGYAGRLAAQAVPTRRR